MSPRAAASRPPARVVGVIVGVLAALACAVAMAATAPAASAKGSATGRNQTFISTADTAVSTFNPFISIQQGEIDVLDEIYPFITYGKEDNNPGPYLATSWKTSADHLTWTFHLRTGLKWSDGQPLTASDAAWTLNLIIHNETAATANGSLVEAFRSVSAPDPGTLTITTSRPQANMLNLLQQIPIVPAHVWRSHVKKLGSFTNTDMPVVGYGPYRFTGYKAPTTMTLTANPSFFNGAPKYHTLIFQYFSDSAGSVAALRNGTVDTSYGWTPTQYHSLQRVTGMKAYQTLSNDWTGVEVNPGARTRSGKAFGTGNPLLHDARVRRAIALGINRDEIVKKVTGGYATVTGSYLTKAFPQWYWTPSAAEAQNYSPAKANALLDSAGYAKRANGYRYAKAGKELSFRLGIHSDSAQDASIANYMVGYMKAIGIKLTVQSQSYTQLNDNLAVGDWDLLMDQWPESADPTYLLSIQTCGVLPKDTHGTGGNTDAFFCNKRYDQLFRDQQQQFDVTRRATDIKAMQKILYNADVDIIMFDTALLWTTRDSHVNGFVYGKPGAGGNYPLQNYELGYAKAVPAAATSGGGGSSSTLIIVIVVVVVVLAGGGLLAVTRRRRTAEERE